MGSTEWNMMLQRSIFGWHPSYHLVMPSHGSIDNMNGDSISLEATVRKRRKRYICSVVLFILVLSVLFQNLIVHESKPSTDGSLDAIINTERNDLWDREDSFLDNRDPGYAEDRPVITKSSGTGKILVHKEGKTDDNQMLMDFDSTATNVKVIENIEEAEVKSSGSLLPTAASERTSRNWFLFDGPGMDPIEPGKALTIWNYNISRELAASRTAMEKRHPEMAFIKGLKVGGTTVAVALDHAARIHRIQLQSVTEKSNIKYPKTVAPCPPDGSLWFHHGFRGKWIKKCMPHVRYLATIREPIGQALSWESMQVNHEYYKHYPRKKCTRKSYLAIEHKKYSSTTLRNALRSINDCIATEFRKNATLMLVANIVESWPETTNVSNGWPGPAVALSANWYIGKSNPRYAVMKSTDVVDALQQYFYLVAPVERMREFLVLLALHMGWKYESLYYVSCKPQDIEVRRADFVKYFPHLAEKLARATQPMAKAYQWAKDNFDSHVERLGPWFQDEVRKFTAGLKMFQQRHAHSLEYRWSTYRYMDGHTEAC